MYLFNTKPFQKMIMLILSIFIIGCPSEPHIKPFIAEGCAIFQNTNFKAIAVNDTDDTGNWCRCCLEFDIAYWRGGSQVQQETAKQRLRDCVYQKTRNKPFADQLYSEAEKNGGNYFSQWPDWGYGWTETKGFSVLNQRQLDIANELLLSYFRNNPSFCSI